jgi:hypothetical protein
MNVFHQDLVYWYLNRTQCQNAKTQKRKNAKRKSVKTPKNIKFLSKRVEIVHIAGHVGSRLRPLPRRGLCQRPLLCGRRLKAGKLCPDHGRRKGGSRLQRGARLAVRRCAVQNFFEIIQKKFRRIWEGFIFSLAKAVKKSCELQPIDGADKYWHLLGTTIKDSA